MPGIDTAQLLLFDDQSAASPQSSSLSAPQGVTWNLWHGCTKFSEGCRNCYVFRRDRKIGVDSRNIYKTRSFALPVLRNRAGEYKYPAGTLFAACFSSDFLHPQCDLWREEAWAMMRSRRDCRFLFLTKRIERFMDCLPADWGAGWDHVAVGATCETQEIADFRLPIFKDCPIRHKIIIHEPLLSAMDVSAFLDHTIEEVVAGGESGPNARPCRWEWFTALRDQCVRAGVPFTFKQTGAVFVKDGKTYRIPRRLQHSQARRAGL
ncbi:MAG: phage Gp37/Gp68 family protein [Treponema sp.]|jgi:protein gp37|nr:phage Gp37/Gp68 family protein [Treponema sp.]